MPHRLRPVLTKVAHSIADQGVSSGTNFIMNILLARWLNRTEYGAFSVAWSFCLFFAAFHNAIILEPMSVIGPSEYGARLSNYLRTVARINWYAVAALGALAAVVGLFYRELVVRHALLTLSLCLPGFLLLLTVRREQYVLNRPIRAFHLSVLYGCLVAVILIVFRTMSWLSALTGLIAIGAALPVAMWGARRTNRVQPEKEKPVIRAHWMYGRWLFGSAILAIGISELQTILLSIFVDLKSAGALRAMMNFILPLAQLATVLSAYTLPRLANRMKVFGVGRGLRQAIIYPAVIALLAVAYVCALIFLGPTLERILYNGKMAQSDKYLPYLGLSALLAAIGAGFSTLLRAAQNSQHQFLSGVIATVVGIGAAMVLLRPYGVAGAIITMILANGASSACIVAVYFLMLRRSRASWSDALADLFKDHLGAQRIPAPAVE